MKYLTPEKVQIRAEDMALSIGYRWSYHPNEIDAAFQARFIAAAVEAMYREGYVNEKVKIK